MSFDIALNERGGLQSLTKFARNHHKKGLPKVLLSMLLLLSLTTFVGAQDGATAPLPAGIDNKAPEAPAPPAATDPTPAATATQETTPGAPAGTPAPATPEPTPSNEPEGEHKTADQLAEEEFLKSGKPRIRIENIYPSQGPASGDTKVVVHGGPFAQFQQEHPEPHCKFGDVTVGGSYVPCRPNKIKHFEREGGKYERSQLCIQCENSPQFAK